MSILMICPKAGECEDCKDMPWMDHVTPHKRLGSCSDHRDKHFRAENNCPPCVPYREFKAGDRVRVLGKTTCNGEYEGISSYYGTSTGSVVKIKSLTSNYCRNCGEKRLYNIEGGNGSVGVYHPQDLKHAEKGDEMEYKEGRRTSIINVYENLGDTCEDVYKHFADLLWTLQMDSVSDTFNFDSLIAWAEKDHKRITWLLEKGYIEKVESEYDRWVGECPKPKDSDGFGSVITLPSSNSYVEWAKRMPK